MIDWVGGIFQANALMFLALILLKAYLCTQRNEFFGKFLARPKWLLNLLIECSRLLLVLFLIGQGSILNGTKRIKELFHYDEANWMQLLRTTKHGLREFFPTVIVNFLAVIAVILFINYILEKIFTENSKRSEGYSYLIKNLLTSPLFICFAVWAIMLVVFGG